MSIATTSPVLRRVVASRWTARAAAAIEGFAGQRLCDLMGHHWGVTPPLSTAARTFPAVKYCACCERTEPLPTAPPADHPDTMTSGVTPAQAAWLARVDPETGCAS